MAMRHVLLLCCLALLSGLLIAQWVRSRAATNPAATPSASIAARLRGLREVNYYPARENWANMWISWDAGTIDADFGRLAALHANTVRLIVQTEAFGYPIPQPVMLQRLAEAIALAHAHGLYVHLTCFDHWSRYGDVGGSEQWVHAVLAPYVHDPRIAFIELQNEIDPGNAAAMAWLRQLLPFVRGMSGRIPLTVSLSGQHGSSGLRSLLATIRPARLDFADYHYYGAPELAYATFQQAQQAAGPLPLFIGETGFSTAPSNAKAVAGLGTSAPSLEAYQDYYYRMVQYAATTLRLPPVAIWTFTDFVPGSISSASPTSAEYDFGLYHAYGSPKPIVASLAREFAQGSVELWFNQGFERCSYGVPYIWQRLDKGAGFFSCDTTVAHGGQASVRISHSSGNTSDGPAFVVCPPLAGPLTGSVYTVTAWARGSNLTGSTQIALVWFDANAQEVGSTTSQALPTGTTGWMRLTARGGAPGGAAYVQIRLESANNQGAAWFDDVSFQR